jgi:hypothetical protein
MKKSGVRNIKELFSPTNFKNPKNGYTESVPRLAWLWTFLFGVIYFAIKGVWRHAFVGFILALCTFGISWLIYPFFAHSILEKQYLRNGWKPVKAG